MQPSEALSSFSLFYVYFSSMLTSTLQFLFFSNDLLFLVFKYSFEIILNLWGILAKTEFEIYFGLGRIHMPLGYYTMQWMNQGPPSLILLKCDVIYQNPRFSMDLEPGYT